MTLWLTGVYQSSPMLIGAHRGSNGLTEAHLGLQWQNGVHWGIPGLTGPHWNVKMYYCDRDWDKLCCFIGIGVKLVVEHYPNQDQSNKARLLWREKVVLFSLFREREQEGLKTWNAVTYNVKTTKRLDWKKLGFDLLNVCPKNSFRLMELEIFKCPASHVGNLNYIVKGFTI